MIALLILTHFVTSWPWPLILKTNRVLYELMMHLCVKFVKISQSVHELCMIFFPGKPTNKPLTHCGLVMPYGNISGSTLVQVMACCLAAPSHYMNQCWLVISGFQLHPCQDNFTTYNLSTNQQNEFENYLYKISFRFPRGEWVIWTYLPKYKFWQISNTGVAGYLICHDVCLTSL